jgi:dTDP-4-dehydrorhamnose reductase
MSDLYHLTAAGCTSWYGFANEIVSTASKREGSTGVTSLTGIPATDYPLPARRPMNSRLSVDKVQTEFNILMPDWKKVMQLCLADVGEYRAG